MSFDCAIQRINAMDFSNVKIITPMTVHRWFGIPMDLDVNADIDLISLKICSFLITTPSGQFRVFLTKYTGTAAQDPFSTEIGLFI